MPSLGQTSRRRDAVMGWMALPLGFACLTIWLPLAIYPDEIAFRQHLGRAVPDHGIVYGLYALCQSNFKTIPWLLRPAAWTMSWAAMSFSPVETRVVPFLLVLSVIALATRYATRGDNPAAALITTASFLGVAGSGLVIARYEYPFECNVMCCLAVVNFLAGPTRSPVRRWVLLAALLFSTTLSLYAHSQGMLLLPLVLYLTYHLAAPRTGRRVAGAVVAGLAIVLLDAAVSLQTLSCDQYPALVTFWRGMVVNLAEVRSHYVIGWIAADAIQYGYNFLYKPDYTISYLPGIVVASVGAQTALVAINAMIILILAGVAALAAVEVVAVSGSVVARAARWYRGRASALPAMADDLCLHATALLLVPVVALFFYDAVHTFYRSFLLNHLAAVALAMLMSRVPFGRRHRVVLLCGLFVGVIAATSLGINAWWFTPRLLAGYEGPSIAIDRDWRTINRDVHALARDCGIDLSQGRIVIDDLTYDSLKTMPITYPITYLALQAQVTRMSASDLLRKIHPNGAITRCASLPALGISAQYQQSDLCCVNFLQP